MEGRPGAADLGSACCGRVRQSPARRGNSCRRQHGASQEVPCCSLERVVVVRCGEARLGVAKRGQERRGGATVADGSKEHFGVPCCSFKRVDMVRRGLVRSGVAWPGEALVADGSTGGLCSLCCSLWRADEAGHGVLRTGAARKGNSCRRQHGGRKPSLLLSSESRWGWVWRGGAWSGKARLQLQTAAQELSGSSAALAREWLWSGVTRNSAARQGEARFGKRRGRFSGLSTQRSSQLCKGLTAPASKVLCF
jgi:hypothetical protein